MIEMIPASESRILDINAEALGVDTVELMGNAGAALVEVLRRYTGKRFLFVCGSGNNGGDGFAAAGMIEDENVTVCLLKPASSINSEASRKFFSKLDCPIIGIKDINLNEYDVVVDCALGTGAYGKLRNPFSDFVDLLRPFDGVIVSADVPTGLGCDTQINPDVTVTFHDSKEGMTEENSGEIIIADICIPEKASRYLGPGDMLRYPVPVHDSHKGSNGKVMIIGGGPYFGAPAMSGLSALRIGADIVNLVVPENVASIVASYSPVFIMRDQLGRGDDVCEFLDRRHVVQLLKASNDFDAVLIGPGLGDDEAVAKAVMSFVSRCKIPMVIDADGIGAIGTGFKSDVPIIFTPHKGEFMKLGGNGECKESDVSSLASSMNSVILLKGETDIISNGERTRLNTTGTPAMTGAGTGDILAGIVAGLLSKGMSPFDSACLGAYICGRAGEYAFETRSYGMIATDLLDGISHTLCTGLRKS